MNFSMKGHLYSREILDIVKTGNGNIMIFFKPTIYYDPPIVEHIEFNENDLLFFEKNAPDKSKKVSISEKIEKECSTIQKLLSNLQRLFKQHVFNRS